MPCDPRNAYIVYDGDCPFCSRYVQLLRLRDIIGQVALVSARDSHPIVRYLTQEGYDLNREMVFVWRGKIYSGGECMLQLALLSTPSNVFNRMNSFLFCNPKVARGAYPFLRGLRNLSLFLLGRKQIPPTADR